METNTSANFCPVCGLQVKAGIACDHGMPARASVPPQPPPAAVPERRPRRSVVEILLDPRSIQWLLALGGVLLVTGLVIWLASLGIFENALVVAGAMGAGTLVVLCAGWWMIRATRYQLAGRAVTLLACLVMPLNLWFYHANHLLTLDGNLWMAAVVCCALYAASALVLRDPLFVYVLMAGVAGTGLLILQDLHRFAEIASPSLMLVVMGLIGIHAERAFLDDESPFSRKHFGKAFFFAGHGLLAMGLLLLLGAQVTGWIIKPIFSDISTSLITTDPGLKLMALAMVLAGAYAYVYSDLVVRKVGAYFYPAALTMLWGEMLCLQMLNLHYRPELILAIVSLTGLVLNIAQALLKDQAKFVRPIPPLAILLSALPTAYGVLLHVRATHVVIHDMWPYSENWGYVAAMIVAAGACRFGAYLYRKTDSGISATYFFLTGAATMVAAAGLLGVSGLAPAWPTQAPILMVIPIIYLIASQLYRDSVERDSLLGVARFITVAMIISVLGSATNLSPRVVEPVEGQPLNLLLALFFAEGAIFYVMLSGIRQQAFHVFLATAMAGGALWQCLSYFNTSAEVYMLTFAAVGLAMLIGARLVKGAPGRSLMAAGNSLMTLSFLSSALMVASRALVSHVVLTNAGLLALMTLFTLAAAVVVRSSGWRHAYIVMSVVNGMLAFVVLEILSTLTGWQKAEIFSIIVGMVMLVAGHIGWFAEQGKPNDTVGFNLLFGSLLAGVPVMIAAMVNRFGYDISLPNEIGLVTISCLLLISGVLLELKTTTIIGGSLLALHLAMLIAFAGWKAQLAVGVYLSVGGAVVFLIGLGLAIYRERLLQLPEKIHRREGIFKVLAWR